MSELTPFFLLSSRVFVGVRTRSALTHHGTLHTTGGGVLGCFATSVGWAESLAALPTGTVETRRRKPYGLSLANNCCYRCMAGTGPAVLRKSVCCLAVCLSVWWVERRYVENTRTGGGLEVRLTVAALSLCEHLSFFLLFFSMSPCASLCDCT